MRTLLISILSIICLTGFAQDEIFPELFLPNTQTSILIPVDSALSSGFTVYTIDQDTSYSNPFKNLFCPAYILNSNEEDFEVWLPNPFNNILTLYHIPPVDIDTDGTEIFTPQAFLTDVDIDEAMPHYISLNNLSSNINPDNPILNYIVLSPSDKKVDIDEAMPHYKSLGYLKPPVDIDEAMPHYIVLKRCGSIPSINLPAYIILSVAGKKVDIDEAMPHY